MFCFRFFSILTRLWTFLAKKVRFQFGFFKDFTSHRTISFASGFGVETRGSKRLS